MTAADQLARIALEAAAAHETADLRPAILTDVAAAAGYGGSLVTYLESVVDGSGPGDRAYRLAARMHVRTQDDFYPAGKAHVGATVLPAALAVGAPDLITAAAAGFSVTKLVSHVYRGRAQERGLRPTGVFAPLGAAAAAGVGLGLSAEQLASAIAIAAATTGGTNQSWIAGTDEWLVLVATAARAGVDAARLAAAGVRGAPDAIEGAAGWAGALFADAGASALLRQLAQPDDGTIGRVATKPYPVSGIAQVPTTAAARIGRQRRAEQGDTWAPTSVTVRMAASDLAYPGSTNRGPFYSRSDALMSVARCVAIALREGVIPLRALERPPSAGEQEIIDAIDLVADPDLAEEEVELTVDGTSLRLTGSEVLYPDFQDLLRDLGELATRSEAPLPVVERLATALRAERVTCSSIVETLEGAARPGAVLS